VGIGSELHGDDAAGVRVVERLGHARSVRRCRLLLCLSGGNAPENVTSPVLAFDPALVLFVDAADLGAPPGTAQLVAPAEIAGVSFSTHTLPLPVLLTYLRGSCAAESYALAIQPASIAFGDELSPAVQQAVLDVATAIRAAIPRAGRSA
jgi:hydrogenase 3 maturation protease